MPPPLTLTPFARRVLFLFLFALHFALRAQEGTPDGFVLPGAPNGPIYAIATQRDGKTIIGGAFTQIGTTTCNRIARLNLDGSIDTTFAISAGANGAVRALVSVIDGGIIVGGEFTTLNGVTCNRIARISSSGTLDTFFNQLSGAGANGAIYCLAYDSSTNRVFAGGDFTTFGGLSRTRLAAFSTSGSLTFIPTFGTGANGPVYTMHAANNKLFIGGAFTQINGASRSRLASFSTISGTLSTFNASGGPNDTVYAIAFSPSDSLLWVGGAFTQIGTTAQPGLAAFTSSDALTPNLNATGTVRSLLVDATGSRIFVGGDFTSLADQPCQRLGRFTKPSASTTWAFDASFAANSAPDGSVTALARTPDDKLIVGGSFSQLESTARPSLARLYGTSGTNPPSAPNAPIVGGSTTTKLVTLYTAGASFTLGYKIDRSPDGVNDWTEIAPEVLNRSSYTDTGLTPDTTYHYRFRAYNSNGVGAPSASGSARTLAQPWALAGAPDIAFNNNLGGGTSSSSVEALAIQPDGKTVVAGNFSTLAGIARKNIARLNADGSFDTGFNPGAGASSTVYAAALQPDGKILIGGSFTTVDGVARNRIARLNSNGTLDTSFAPSTGASSTVSSIVVQPDGAILLAGDFSTINGTTRNGIARLTSAGATDASFDPGAGLSFAAGHQLALQPDGGVIVVGFFQSAAGTARGNIARFFPNGALDTTFASGAGADTWIESLRLLPDGRIYIVGPFSTYNGVAREGIARLLPNGNLDPGFNPSAGVQNGWSFDIEIQPDGKPVIGGWFNQVRGRVCLGLARFTTTGLLDDTFYPGLGANSDVNVLAALPDGKMLVGGSFSQLGDSTLGRIGRLLGDTGVAVPPAPLTLSATVLSSSRVQLTWAAVPLVTGYRLEQSPDGLGNWSPVATASPGVTSATAEGLGARSQTFFRAIALNTNGASPASAVVAARTYSAYEEWRLGQALALDSTADADTDGDGLPDLLEYALGSDPASPASGALPVPVIAAGRLEFSYARLRADLDYVVESSLNLQTWSAADVDQGLPGTTTTASTPLDDTRKFLRLKITAR